MISPAACAVPYPPDSRVLLGRIRSGFHDVHGCGKDCARAHQWMEGGTGHLGHVADRAATRHSTIHQPGHCVSCARAILTLPYVRDSSPISWMTERTLQAGRISTSCSACLASARNHAALHSDLTSHTNLVRMLACQSRYLLCRLIVPSSL